MKLTSNRQRRILEMLDADEELHVAALAQSLDVSQETIRRDLSHLEIMGALRRVHGGAISLSSPRLRSLSERAEVKQSEKARIAELAARFVGEGQTVFIGEGTTALALAHHLAGRVSARYMTAMIDIAQSLAANKRNEVSLTGGVYDRDLNVLTGLGAIRGVEERLFDVAITGASGIHPELGFLDYNEALVALYRTVTRHCKRYIVLADHSKFGKTPPICAFPLDRVDVVVTDRMPASVFCDALAAANVALVTPESATVIGDGNLEN